MRNVIQGAGDGGCNVATSGLRRFVDEMHFARAIGEVDFAENAQQSFKALLGNTNDLSLYGNLRDLGLSELGVPLADIFSDAKKKETDLITFDRKTYPRLWKWGFPEISIVRMGPKITKGDGAANNLRKAQEAFQVAEPIFRQFLDNSDVRYIVTSKGKSTGYAAQDPLVRYAAPMPGLTFLTDIRPSYEGGEITKERNRQILQEAAQYNNLGFKIITMLNDAGYVVPTPVKEAQRNLNGLFGDSVSGLMFCFGQRTSFDTNDLREWFLQDGPGRIAVYSFPVHEGMGDAQFSQMIEQLISTQCFELGYIMAGAAITQGRDILNTAGKAAKSAMAAAANKHNRAFLEELTKVRKHDPSLIKERIIYQVGDVKDLPTFQPFDAHIDSPTQPKVTILLSGFCAKSKVGTFKLPDPWDEKTWFSDSSEPGAPENDGHKETIHAIGFQPTTRTASSAGTVAKSNNGAAARETVSESDNGGPDTTGVITPNHEEAPVTTGAKSANGDELSHNHENSPPDTNMNGHPPGAAKTEAIATEEPSPQATRIPRGGAPAPQPANKHVAGSRSISEAILLVEKHLNGGSKNGEKSNGKNNGSKAVFETSLKVAPNPIAKLVATAISKDDTDVSAAACDILIDPLLHTLIDLQRVTAVEVGSILSSLSDLAQQGVMLPEDVRTVMADLYIPTLEDREVLIIKNQSINAVADELTRVKLETLTRVFGEQVVRRSIAGLKRIIHDKGTEDESGTGQKAKPRLVQRDEQAITAAQYDREVTPPPGLGQRIIGAFRRAPASADH